MSNSNRIKKEGVSGSIHTSEGIGRRLKTLRTSRGLTLAELAGQTDLSISSLSQVERGLVSPTIRTVYALSVALGVSLAWIVDPDSVTTGDPDAPYVVRATRRRQIYSHNGVTKHLVTPQCSERYVGFIVTIEPNGSSGEEQYTHAGEELAIILSGTLVLEIEDKVCRVNKGDSFAFPSSLPHRFYNDTSADTVVFWINSPE
ncbi:MAG: cupin domain-containing protein [Steroidobacteraceae bacterium]|jgi:transcriptional regulator with XRE-family HTH domain